MSEAPSGEVAPLSYASSLFDRRPIIVLYRVTVFCAVVPLVIGVTTLALYALTFWEVLQLVGAFTMLAGGVLCFIGLVCVTVFYVGLRRCDPELRGAWRPRAARIATLLVGNVPIAVVCAVVGIYLTGLFRVTLVNGSDAPITQITVTSPGETVQVARLDPGESRRVYLSIDNDGEVMLTATQNGERIQESIDGYVTNGMGGKAAVTFTRAGRAVKRG